MKGLLEMLLRVVTVIVLIAAGWIVWKSLGMVVGTEFAMLISIRALLALTMIWLVLFGWVCILRADDTKRVRGEILESLTRLEKSKQ